MGRASRATLRARFEAKVERRGPDECHPWRGAVGSHGYGQINVEGVPELAHRVAYELAIGPIPDGHQVDHVRDRGCTLRLCVNEHHLEAVTQQENIRRQTVVTEPAQRASVAAARARTHCANGHEYTPENTGIRAGTNGWRYCRTCKREREAHARSI